MNYDLLKRKMDKFFEETSPEEIVREFQNMGYEFVPSPVLEWNNLGSLQVNEYLCKPRKTRFWQRSSNVSRKKLTSEFPGSFFLLKIVT